MLKGRLSQQIDKVERLQANDASYDGDLFVECTLTKALARVAQCSKMAATKLLCTIQMKGTERDVCYACACVSAIFWDSM